MRGAHIPEVCDHLSWLQGVFTEVHHRSARTRQSGCKDLAPQGRGGRSHLPCRYHIMTLVPIVDNVLYQSQRQGRISFYMQCAGEEAATVGSAAAMLPNDEMYGQYVRHPSEHRRSKALADTDHRESRQRCCIEDSHSKT